MPRLQKPHQGRLIPNPPSGFPAFMGRQQPRVITADIWAFLQHQISTRLPKPKCIQASAFLDQALEFFEAARSPSLSCRPLLYYYSFLNLAKVFLTLKTVMIPVVLKHGISDSKVNRRQRLRLEGQTVRVPKRANDHSELFPEFVTALGGKLTKPATLKVMSLLRQLPGIHRTFCRVTGERTAFLPVKQFDLLRDGNDIFVRMILDRSDKDVGETLRRIRLRRSFTAVFRQVSSTENGEVWFETECERGKGRGIYTAVKRLATIIESMGVWGLLTTAGWRYYLAAIPPRSKLPPCAAVYATMFYLGSIVRYQPYDFDRVFAGKFSWLVSEFFRTQPIQFIYGLAGRVAGVDVVRPLASLE